VDRYYARETPQDINPRNIRVIFNWQVEKMSSQILRRYTLDERTKIEECIKKNLSLFEMEPIVGRSKYSIKNEIRKNGGKFYYNAEAAQRLADENNLKKALYLSRINSRPPTQSSHSVLSKIEDKIQNLEQHIEILFDLIKEKK
jgi:IS30 family transposase